ncbi:hypothetical protein [Streptomyces sp. NPDC055036]
MADHILGFSAEQEKRPPVVAPAVERLTGRPGRTFAEWAVEHAADFRDEQLVV